MNHFLNYEGFEEFLVGGCGRALNGGVQYEFHFENNYGASVVKHSFSYGHENDLWELAVLRNYRGMIPFGDWELCYSTPITNDVLGWLTDEKVRTLLQQIKEL